MALINFNNDYSQSAHPEILKSISDFTKSYQGYSDDEISLKVQNTVKKMIGNPQAEVQFVVGGTQANIIAISSLLSPIEAVIAVESAHINVHETGAIEARGHKILTIPGKEGKVVISQIREVLAAHLDEHMVIPRLVFISNATELGTIYSKKELTELSRFCKQNKLLLYIDGARLAQALTSHANDVSLKDLAKLCDAFYLGGTKNGLLMGEILIFNNKNLAKNIRYHIKQNGALLAKGFLLGLQFNKVFEKELYFKLASNANKQAEKIQQALLLNKFELFSNSVTNQIFVYMSNNQINRLKRNFSFSIWKRISPQKNIIRFVTSWATNNNDVLTLIKELKNL
jgi:threonine aldolase